MPGTEQKGFDLFPPREEIKADKVLLKSPFFANLLLMICRNALIRFA
jgi:hypothetical protein